MAISTYHSGESVLHRAMVGRLTQASVRGWGSALGSVNTGNHVSRNTACIWLVKAPGVKQPTIEVAAVVTDSCHKERVINCQQAPWPEDDVTPLRPLYTFANLPLGLRGKAGGGARVTARPKRPHLGVCPGPNSSLMGEGAALAGGSMDRIPALPVSA